MVSDSQIANSKSKFDMLSRLRNECNSLNCGVDNHIDPAKNLYHIQNHTGHRVLFPMLLIHENLSLSVN